MRTKKSFTNNSRHMLIHLRGILRFFHYVFSTRYILFLFVLKCFLTSGSPSRAYPLNFIRFEILD